MSKTLLLAGGLFVLLGAAPAFAQSTGGAAAGAATGALGGAIVGGPIGAAVGVVTGAIIGSIAGPQQPELRPYVVTQDVPSSRSRRAVRAGTMVPSRGVTYYQAPAEYGAPASRYTVVNDTPVLVNPRTRRIAQIVP
ncbi:MAG: DUF1236 domain-containing protein [Microvirga sp.]